MFYDADAGADSKTGIISSIPDDSTLTALAGAQNVKEVNNATITKTGNNRMIAGYRCDESRLLIRMKKAMEMSG